MFILFPVSYLVRIQTWKKNSKVPNTCAKLFYMSTLKSIINMPKPYC